MSSISLFRKKENALPSSVTVGGRQFPINADFRNILKILRLIEDGGVDERYKAILACQWFYTEDVPPGGVNEIIKFITGAEDDDIRRRAENGCDEPSTPRRYDYEYDAEEIYASFLKDYRIDLLDIPFLHYRKFLIMLLNLSDESPFKQKVQLRFKDLSGLKGRALSAAMEAKEAVQLPVKLTEEELAEQEAFERVWGKVGKSSRL